MLHGQILYTPQFYTLDARLLLSMRSVVSVLLAARLVVLLGVPLHDTAAALEAVSSARQQKLPKPGSRRKLPDSAGTWGPSASPRPLESIPQKMANRWFSAPPQGSAKAVLQHSPLSKHGLRRATDNDEADLFKPIQRGRTPFLDEYLCFLGFLIPFLCALYV